MKIFIDCEICGKEFRVENDSEVRGSCLYLRELSQITDGLSWDIVCVDCKKTIVDAIKVAVTKIKNGKRA